MTAFTYLHPYQNTHIIASECDTFLFEVEHRRGLSANTLSFYYRDLPATGSLNRGSINGIILTDIESYLTVRDESPSTAIGTSSVCINSSILIDMYDSA